MGIKLKCTQECPIHLLWVGHRFVPRAFPQPKWKGDHVSYTIPSVHKMKTDLLLKRITTISGTKIKQEFLLGGLIKGTQCEVTSKNPWQHPLNSHSRELAVCSGFWDGPWYQPMASHQNTGKDTLTRRGLKEANQGTPLTTQPSWVYVEVHARLDQWVLSKPSSCCCCFCPQSFWWILHGSKFEIALRGYSYFTLPAELRGVGGGGAFNFYCGHLGRSLSSLVVPGGQDCLTSYLGGLEHSGHNRTFLPPFKPTYLPVGPIPIRHSSPDKGSASPEFWNQLLIIPQFCIF